MRAVKRSLLYRARTLGTLDENAYQNAMKTMSRRGWRRREPGYLGSPERPQMLPKAMEALANVGFTTNDLVELTRLSEATLRMIVGVEGEGVTEVSPRLSDEPADY